MTKNPFINALAAVGYIVLVVTVISNLPGPDTEFLTPIAALSLLTLSVSVMGYLFFYGPLQIYLGGEKERAVNFFLKTLGVFAGITALVLLTLFFRAF